MIVTRLTLHNFKQYRGEHTWNIAEEAIVGVVGANGVGKTTIFEAIEWCLYKPRNYGTTDIRPRTTGGEVRVIVQLTTGDQTWEVERVLKRHATTATVYRINAMGGSEPVVQGTREVTEYISTTLLGLGHAAFVATFFTRQKELGFFATLKPTDRRREVGRLLGFETIKTAQSIIGDDRSEARSDADALRRQVEARTGGRDLAAEISAATETITGRADTEAIASAAIAAAERRVTETDADHQTHLLQRDEDAALAAELREVRARHQSTIERLESIGRDLERLEAQEVERGGLVPVADALPAHRQRQAELDAERERFQRRQRSERERERLAGDRRRRLGDVRETVAGVGGLPVTSGWRWGDEDDTDPVKAMDRLIDAASSVDVDAPEARLALLRAAVRGNEDHERAREQLALYQRTVDELTRKAKRLRALGDPATLVAEARDEIEQTQSGVSSAKAEIAALQDQQVRPEALVARLRHQQFDEDCPTCGRPFTDGEAQTVIATLEMAIADRGRTIEHLRERAAGLTRERETLQSRIRDLEEQDKELTTAQTRADAGTRHVEDKREECERLAHALATGLRDLDLARPPTAADVAASSDDLRNRRRLRDAGPVLARIRTATIDVLERERLTASELEELADAAWDEATYLAVTREVDAATRATSAIEQIDGHLARRPQLIHDRDTVREAMQAGDAVIADLERRRVEVGFAPEALQLAAEALAAARRDDRAAHDRLHAARAERRDAEFALSALAKERDDLDALTRQADERLRQRDDLDAMYREFAEFDRYVAQHLSPRLAELTSDIVGEMTDGTYDRVTFDEDFGIRVYDRTEEGFPLETFSGGERDAVALAARLALSRLIAEGAANPPGFLVLDEVFGSLDADRRERVLGLLGRHATEHFRQMFIISHVDDVQQSPVFDAIWQVEQDDEGSSRIRMDGALEPVQVGDGEGAS